MGLHLCCVAWRGRHRTKEVSCAWNQSQMGRQIVFRSPSADVRVRVRVMYVCARLWDDFYSIILHTANTDYNTHSIHPLDKNVSAETTDAQTCAQIYKSTSLLSLLISSPWLKAVGGVIILLPHALVELIVDKGQLLTNRQAQHLPLLWAVAERLP